LDIRPKVTGNRRSALKRRGLQDGGRAAGQADLAAQRHVGLGAHRASVGAQRQHGSNAPKARRQLLHHLVSSQQYALLVATLAQLEPRSQAQSGPQPRLDIDTSRGTSSRWPAAGEVIRSEIDEG
jgi:hypothetical protein